MRTKRYGAKNGLRFRNSFTYGATQVPHDEKLIREGKGGRGLQGDGELHFRIHEEQWCREGDDGWVASNNLLVLADGGNASKGTADAIKDEHTGLYAKVLAAELKIMTEKDPTRDLGKVLTHAVAVNPVTKGTSSVCLA